MDCSAFRRLYLQYEGDVVPGEPWEFDVYTDWAQHRGGCGECTTWRLTYEVHSRGGSVDNHPCVHVAYYAALALDTEYAAFETPECVVTYDVRFDEYAIGARGGSGDDVLIAYCPWCGVRLPDSKRKAWQDGLRRQGIDPDFHDIPADFLSGKWWRRDEQS